MKLMEYKRQKEKGFHPTVNEKAYHVTYKNRVESIMKNGLKPINEGSGLKNFEWSDERIYMSSDKYGGLECIAMLYYDKKEEGIDIGGELALLEVDLGKLEPEILNTGEAFEKWGNEQAEVVEWVYKGIIDSKNIKEIRIDTTFREDELNKAFGLKI